MASIGMSNTNTSTKTATISQNNPTQSTIANSPKSNPSENKISNQVATPSESNVVKVGDFEFSNANKESYDYSGSADVAGRLIKVSFDVKNIGNKSNAPAYVIEYTVKDDRGREFEEAALTIGMFDQNIKKTTTNNILPGSTNRVSLIFDVAQDAKNFQLGLSQAFGGKEWLKIN
jgi:hypothetical protein